jgi:hypothetical protein
MTRSPLPVLVGLALLGPWAPLTARSAVGPDAPVKAKDSVEAQVARQTFKQVLDTVDSKWFGTPYAGVNAVDLQGTLTIQLSAAAVNARLAQAGQGLLKPSEAGTTVRLNLKGTYFANADFRTEITGDFGHLLYCRVGSKGFLYSKEQNAWTSRVDPPPADAPSSFLGWFRQCLNEIQSVYVDGTTFKARLGPEAGGGRQALTFSCPTGAFDTRRHEQSLAASLGFWKRGQLELVFDKTSRLPQQLQFRNENQGVATRASFSHNPDGRLGQVVMANQSRGMEGPAGLTLGYDAGGLIDHVAGQMGFSKGSLRFDLACAFARDRKTSSIVTLPPPTATKKGREELETLLLVGLAGKVLDLQHQGLNLRSVAPGAHG